MNPTNGTWIQQVKKQDEVEKRVDLQTIHFHIIDIGGNPHFWGYPQNDSMKENWPKYSQVVGYMTEKPDLVLIDGRFRVACAIQVALHAKDDVVICIHDYTNRPHYHCVTQFLEEVEVVETFACFVKKKCVDEEFLKNLYEQYKYDAR